MRDGWKEISLEDLETSGVIKLGRGDVISKKDMEADPGPNPVYSSAENKNGMIGKYAKFMFDEELITWSVDGGGHIFYRPKHKFSVTNIGGWLRILDDKVFSYQFLTYALQRLHKQHSFDWQHKAHPSVIRKLYTRIPLPSLPEQKRIVDLVSSVDSYIEALQQQLESAKRSRNAVLYGLLTAGGDDWVETSLGDIADWGSGGTPKADNAEYYGGGIPWCVIGDLTEGEVWETEKTISKLGLTNSSAKIIDPGSVLLAMYGASIGRTGLSAVPMATNQAIAFAKCKEERVLPKYLLVYLQTQKSKFIEMGQGAAQPNISQTIIKSWPISLPPIGQQKKVIVRIESFSKLIENTELMLSETRKLRSSLLSDLLSGRHEIPESYDKVMSAA